MAEPRLQGRRGTVFAADGFEPVKLQRAAQALRRAAVQGASPPP
jgi:hypothetical protein